MSGIELRPPIVMANWKSNGTLAETREWTRGFGDRPAGISVGVCPPNPFVMALLGLLPDGILVGSQDVSAHGAGAYTGEVSAAALADCGCSFALVGHSERRIHMDETDAVVCAKLHAAWDAGLSALMCVGETLEQREQGLAEATVEKQLRQALGPVRERMPHGGTPLMVGYEPVWAIGSGRTPSEDEISAIHRHVASCVADILGDRVKIPVLYGGSVKVSNARAVMSLSGVDGVLVGGESLFPDRFREICAQAAEARP